jgi:predicted O-linked N-acetylglucosamine transferase (SPINDLY family)
MDEEILHKAIAADPHRGELHFQLAGLLMNRGRYDEALASYRQAAALNPDSAGAHYNIGVVLAQLNRMEEAVAAFQKSLQILPNQPECQNNLAIALGNLGRFEESIHASHKALALKPDFAKAHNNLGNILLKMGRPEESLAAFRSAITAAPDYAIAHSNLIFAMNLLPGYDARAILNEARQWDEQHGKPLRHLIQPHINNRDPDRQLRIGYVSADFREHVVGWNLLPLLREHDRKQVEIFCYSSVSVTDSLSQQLRNEAQHWRDVAPLSDIELADQIHTDGIDILIDLSLHTAKNRLRVFAMVPAPVQITYLGYCGTSGIDGMHYRFSDPHLDPPETDLSNYSEQTIRLPETYWCYSPGGDSPDISPPPAEKNGWITFGCLNQLAKISSLAVEAWCEILKRVERSHLLMHAPPGKQQEILRERFATLGVSRDRIEFVDRQPWEPYMQTYHRIDIGLDPFPYGGGITTCDALWMGVPVISLSGETPVGRGGRSILSNLGLGDLVAHSTAKYAKIAVNLARDVPRLRDLRKALRSRMQTSALMNAPRFARNVEAAYRSAWQRWCARP